MRVKVPLLEKEMPRKWYNLAADLPSPMNPPLGPNGKPISPDMLAPVFPMNLIEQEVSQERWIDIPEEVLDLLYRWRPTPLHRATYLEQALGTPARIYYKNESISPPGSHKPNTAVAQAWYNKQFGIKRIVTETGAGQWGSALAFACALLGLAEHPDSPGSLGIAISEAIESAVTEHSGTTRYALGSVLNHVLLHQTIIGLEAKEQLKKIGEKKVDVVIACAGGGSNFAGLAFPFVNDKIHGAKIDIIPVEPFSCPTMTKASFVYDHGDTARMTPLLPMHSLGHDFVPPPIHAGGLRYHGIAPLISAGIVEGLITPKAMHQLESYGAAVQFAKTEGIIPAPETSHAIAEVIRQAKQAKEEGKQKVILFNMSGHGLMDLSGYERYFSGQLVDYELPQADIDAALERIKDFPKPAANRTGRW
jgi:tryptophan synthase beta chain